MMANGNITFRDSAEPDSLICRFMGTVDRFVEENSGFKTLGYREESTGTAKAMRISVFIAEKGYDPASEGYACFQQ